MNSKEANGYTVFQFKRKFVTCDSHDRNIEVNFLLDFSIYSIFIISFSNNHFSNTDWLSAHHFFVGSTRSQQHDKQRHQLSRSHTARLEESRHHNIDINDKSHVAFGRSEDFFCHGQCDYSKQVHLLLQ